MAHFENTELDIVDFSCNTECSIRQFVTRQLIEKTLDGIIKENLQFRICSVLSIFRPTNIIIFKK